MKFAIMEDRIDSIALKTHYKLCPLLPQLLWPLRRCHLLFAPIRSEQHFSSSYIPLSVLVIFDVVDGEDHAFKCQNFRPGRGIYKREKHY